jgi:hypothetical protein
VAFTVFSVLFAVAGDDCCTPFANRTSDGPSVTPTESSYMTLRNRRARGPYHGLRQRGGHLRLLCPSDRCRRVFALTHLLTVFDPYASEDAALRSFTGPSMVPA